MYSTFPLRAGVTLEEHCHHPIFETLLERLVVGTALVYLRAFHFSNHCHGMSPQTNAPVLLQEISPRPRGLWPTERQGRRSRREHVQGWPEMPPCRHADRGSETSTRFAEANQGSRLTHQDRQNRRCALCREATLLLTVQRIPSRGFNRIGRGPCASVHRSTAEAASGSRRADRGGTSA